MSPKWKRQLYSIYYLTFVVFFYPETVHVKSMSTKKEAKFHTVDGWNPANQLRLVVYPMIYRVLHMPGGAGFLPSTVVPRIWWTDNNWEIEQTWDEPGIGRHAEWMCILILTEVTHTHRDH